MSSCKGTSDLPSAARKRENCSNGISDILEQLCISFNEYKASLVSRRRQMGRWCHDPHHIQSANALYSLKQKNTRVFLNGTDAIRVTLSDSGSIVHTCVGRKQHLLCVAQTTIVCYSIPAARLFCHTNKYILAKLAQTNN